ncbi:MAG: thiolase family protein [Melioribacteraceae bacterium]|nr:thiolase family protein [Melioribacteraceae bacterium]
MKRVFIVDAKRTPIGSFLGSLSNLSAPMLGAEVIKDIMKRNNLAPNTIDEVIMGNVLSAGIGQAPARQTAIFAGLSDKTETLTINKMCGSGLKAVMLAQQAISVGDANLIIAGGIESMSNAPFLLPNVRNGLRLGHSKLYDSMIYDGLWDVYNNIHMGNCAEITAREFGFSRTDLDEFAIESYKRAIKAQEEGKFNDEITKIEINDKTKKIVDKDEEPSKVNFEKIPSLKPAFEKDGIITAANASKINDGAAAVLISNEDKIKEFGLKPRFEIIAQASAAKDPIHFTTAPADAISKLLSKTNLTISDIDIFEINEAFAVVSLAINKLLNLDINKVNQNGGAIALGHPIGASGARILTTLIYEMERKNLEYGIASLCIGGGEASAILIKKL